MKTIAQTFIEQGRTEARQEMQEEIQKLRQEINEKAHQEAAPCLNGEKSTSGDGSRS